MNRFIALKKELLSALDGWGIEAEGGLHDGTSLIRSGLLDSLTLFHLAAWVEEQIGTPLDPGTLNLAEEWDTVGGILRFVERQCRADSAVVGEK